MRKDKEKSSATMEGRCRRREEEQLLSSESTHVRYTNFSEPNVTYIAPQLEIWDFVSE